MPIVKKTFVITSATGSTRFVEGMSVPQDIANMYPMFMEGYVSGKKEVAHDPTLAEKLTRAAAEKMTDARLEKWIMQYHPEMAPEGKLKREDFIDLVMAAQE